MADFYPPHQFSQTLEIDESIVAKLEAKGVLQPTFKNGKKFFSSRQAYLLRAALRLARKDKIGLEEAFARLEGRWLAQNQ
jgi:hypothetical protein